MSHSLINNEVKSLIYHIRGSAVMLDSDLANLYQVPTGRLNEAALLLTPVAVFPLK